MTPIEKNIIVVDENGKEYEATYPKRANGLVKSGRARFIAENKLCLLCPPDITEENDMSENIKNAENAVNGENTSNNRSKYTLDYVLSQISQNRLNQQKFHQRTSMHSSQK